MIEIQAKKSQKSQWQVIKEKFGERAIDILEIGVYKAASIEGAKSRVNVSSYTGIEPYFGDSSDPYKGSYWENELEALNTYIKSDARFKELGGVLYKTTSELYFRSLTDQMWDLIYVDGNHKFYPAFSDMCHWFSKVRDGGVMMVDDYANVDVPDVTKAVNMFLNLFYDSIENVDELVWEFRNDGKYIPVVNKKIFITKKRQTNNKDIFIWGAGGIGTRVLEKWNNVFSGYLDSYVEQDYWNGLKKANLEDLDSNSIVVLALNDKNTNEVMRTIKNIAKQKNIIVLLVSQFDIYMGEWRY